MEVLRCPQYGETNLSVCDQCDHSDSVVTEAFCSLLSLGQTLDPIVRQPAALPNNMTSGIKGGVRLENQEKRKFGYASAD